MRYIRTKSNIYETEARYLDNNGKWIGYSLVDYDMAFIVRSQVNREADTIEELCDEFVVIRDTTKITQLVRADDIDYLKEVMESDKRIIEVKGAIWTEWGLKYVARMNNDGKLKLI